MWEELVWGRIKDLFLMTTNEHLLVCRVGLATKVVCEGFAGMIPKKFLMAPIPVDLHAPPHTDNMYQ